MHRFSLPTLHTWFDLLNATISPETLLDAAEQRGMSAVGIVDHATTLAHVRLARAATQRSVHVVFGTTLTMADGLPLRILARTDQGYQSLCRLVSAQHRHPDGLPFELIRDHRHGLYVLCGGRGGRLWQTVARGQHQKALALMGKLQGLAERDSQFVIECQQYHDDRVDDGETLRWLLELAATAGVRCMATHDVHVLRDEDAATHRLLRAIQLQTSFYSADERLPAWTPGQRSCYSLPDAPTWFQRWDGLEHLPAGSAAVLHNCTVDLIGPRRFPGASIPPGQIYDELWQRAFDGLKARYARITPELMTQLHHEINEISQQDVGAFLLQAAELVARASAKGIRMILQGSGTGSLTAYALGISPVEPMRAGGIFERFAGTHRGIGDVPDLDFGVPAGRERDIVALLHEMHGAEHVAYLTAVSKLSGRSTVRAAAMAFGWSSDQIRLLHRKLKHGDTLDRTERMVINAADALEGQPAHLMRHPSGNIVTDQPVQDVFGRGVCADGPMVLADKDDAEALQVLKLDVLSWFGSAMLDHAQAALQVTTYPRPDVWHVDPFDERTGDLLANADTRAIPYLQSPAMMTLLRALRVRTEDDLALALGALRPGASTTRPRLIAAMRGHEAAIPGWHVFSKDHQAALATVLASSRGAFIFDEDLLRVLHLLGFGYADAERLRKALKKGDERTTRAEYQIRAAALGNGWTDDEIDVLVEHFRFIQRYCFLRGHALALAYMTFRVAHLAAHAPAHFYAAVFDHMAQGGGGMYPMLVYVVEAQRNGLTVRPPTINSGWVSTAHGTTVQCGLRVLRGALSPATLQEIATEGTRHPFTSIGDLCRRVTVSAHELDMLIGSGALDALTESRRMARRAAAWARRQPCNQALLLDETPIVQGGEAVEPESIADRATEEYATLGFCTSLDHPLDLYSQELAQVDVVPSTDLPHRIGGEVALAGIVVAHRRIRTSHGDPMVFISLCDRQGVVEVTVFAHLAQQMLEPVRADAVLVVQGLVTNHLERGLGLDAQSIKVICDQPRRQQPHSQTHDWLLFEDR